MKLDVNVGVTSLVQWLLDFCNGYKDRPVNQIQIIIIMMYLFGR